MHKHEQCSHQLEHCSHCDIVYCSKCKKEWVIDKQYFKYDVVKFVEQPNKMWWQDGMMCGGNSYHKTL